MSSSAATAASTRTSAGSQGAPDGRVKPGPRQGWAGEEPSTADHPFGRGTGSRGRRNVADMPIDLLIVEDDASSAAFATHLFAASGHRVRVAGDLDAMAEMVATDPPDAVLLDLRVPERAGERPSDVGRLAARRLRAVLEDDVRIVGLSVLEPPHDWAEFPDDHLCKPASPRELLAVVEKPRGR